MSTLERAIAIAVEAHAGQVDKAGAPYILHALRVMLRMETTEERIIAVLHDAVEDTHWTFDRLRAEGFSDRVLAAIDSVTKRHNETYDEFIDRAARNVVGRRVKFADLEDNVDLGRIAQPTESDHARIEKYRRAIARLQGEAARPAP